MDTLEEIIDSEEYRDSIATVDESGKRIWVSPKKPKGRFHNRRTWVAYTLLLAFFATPFIWVNGHPLFMFNILERKFILFGRIFMPQDFHLVALGLITFFVFVILFTVVYGRIWCGWICPQTLFMEMVYRKIEYWIEGDSSKQRKLNAAPWNTEKILKKGGKQIIFLSIAVLVAHTVMAYMMGIDQVFEIVSQPPTKHLSGFTALCAFTFIFYGVFAYMREQACIAVCPYGRLQSVLLDKDSVVISYDFKRGEPRGKLKRKTDKGSNGHPFNIDDLERPKGDCIDCKLCVQVCPTGIDIRNGTQMECINCTACIDACDEVMDKVKKPRGLIRFASYNNIHKNTPFSFTPRIIAYTIVLLLLVGFQAYLLTNREKVETTVLRIPGSLYTKLPDGNLRNIYKIQIANKSFDELDIQLKLKGLEGKVQIAGNEFTAEPNTSTAGTIMIDLDPNILDSFETKVYLEVWSGGELLETVRTGFLGPMK